MKKNKRMFLKIWCRVGVPILALTTVVFCLCVSMIMLAMEALDIQRVEINGSQLALLLTDMDLSDKPAVEERLDLSAFQMAGILYDDAGKETARSDIGSYEYEHGRYPLLYDDAGKETARSDTGSYERGRYSLDCYQKMEEMLASLHAGEPEKKSATQIFGYNYEYGARQIRTEQGDYVLYYAGVSAPWILHGRKILMLGFVIFAGIAALTICIAGSYYRIYLKQEKLKATHSKTVNELAHSLKTPMMAISGYSENFLAEVQMQKSRHYAEAIVENVKKMNGIVEKMLDFAGE